MLSPLTPRALACLLAAFAVASLGLASESLAVPITVPTGLSPGAQYRLAFVTSTTRDATSSNIADYNAFVTATANAVPELAALGTTWTAIASTSSVYAQDNTSTNPGITGVPIYLLNDTLLASDNANLWGGWGSSPLVNPLRYDENAVLLGDVYVWTGTDADGSLLR